MDSFLRKIQTIHGYGTTTYPNGRISGEMDRWKTT